MTWLVTGGAGYIGSHITRAFLEAGIDVVVLDDLSSGHREFVDPRATFVEGTLLDPAVCRDAVGRGVDGVVHVAGYKYAGESVRRPLHTYHQNVTAMVNLLEAMDEAGCGRAVFSGSASFYGTPRQELVTEDVPAAPESPYGETKVIGEWLLRDMQRAWSLDGRDFRWTSLRYFNVVGSGHPDLYDTSPYNLFPIVFERLLDGRTPAIFGDDYATDDGTCVRDYVHVQDIALAHVAAAQALQADKALENVYNLGSGSGSSVRQIMDAMARGTGIAFTPEVKERRPGDPDRIVADGTLAARDLGWAMRHSLDDMVHSAWEARSAAGKGSQG